MKKSEPTTYTPPKKQPVFSFVKGILRLFLRKPKRIINLAGELDERAIIVANHSAKLGPLYLELYFPLFHCVWGAGEMLGNYKSRYHYLKDVFYIQKRKFGNFRASISAAFEAIFSPMIYKGMKVLPTYKSGRLLSTVNKSIDALKSGSAIMIFPENSDNGYFDELPEFFPGFVLLSTAYYHKTGEDVPVYPTYYHIKKRILCIGKPFFVQDLKNKGLSRKQIADFFLERVNDLYHTYCEN